MITRNVVLMLLTISSFISCGKGSGDAPGDAGESPTGNPAINPDTPDKMC